MAALRDDIVSLQQPTEIFEIGPTSGADDGFCIENLPCNITIRIHRTAEGENCQIIVGGRRYYFTDIQTQQRREVFIENPTPERNVGREWTDLKFTLVTPSGLVTAPERGAFVFVASYTQCTADSGGQVAFDESPMIPLRVYRTLDEAPK